MIPANKPAEYTPPFLVVSNSTLLQGFVANSKPGKILGLNSSHFCLFFLPNEAAKSLLYEAIIHFLSGCFPKHHAGTVSVIVVLFPNCGGTDINNTSIACPVSVSKNS